MNQIYYKYEEWEDYQNGMYQTEFKEEELLINNAVKLLSNEPEFYNISLEMIGIWEKSADVNLSNTKHNRQSWIGQAACCYKCGTPELLTREAWARLDRPTQTRANLIADKIIRIYEEKNRRLYQNVGTKVLF